MLKIIKQLIKRYLGFSNSESVGFLFLIIILILFAFLPFVLDLLPFKSTSENYDQKKLDSLKINLQAKINTKKASEKEYPDYSANYNYDQFSSEKFESKSHKLFDFDPNTIDVTGLISLGLPKFLAERIEKYRNAGGKFKKAEDFKKIYGLLPSTYSKLEPYIKINTANKLPNEYSTSNKNIELVTKNEVELPKTENRFGKHPVAFDLNKADTTTLMNLKGIGSKLSMRIIKFRDNLGGFVSENQIREVYGLDSTVVTEILKYGKVKSAIYNKIDINNASEIKHPYLKPYLAKAIIAYRNQHGKFGSANDLKNIKIIDEATIEKIKPYLKF